MSLPHATRILHRAGRDLEALARFVELGRVGEELAILLVAPDIVTSHHTTFLSADSLAITQMSLNTRAL